jgi:hypothetical protein
MLGVVVGVPKHPNKSPCVRQRTARPLGQGGTPSARPCSPPTNRLTEPSDSSQPAGSTCGVAALRRPGPRVRGRAESDPVTRTVPHPLIRLGVPTPTRRPA